MNGINARFFEKKVDHRSRDSMVGFLKGHYRYNTLNGWNMRSSYANNVKVHRLGLPEGVLASAFDAVQTDFWGEVATHLIDDFTAEMNDGYTIGSNGRSGGYLVLYDSYRERTGHLSFCGQCGQRNFKKVPPMFADENDQVIASAILRSNNARFPKSYLEEPVIQSLSIADDDKLRRVISLKMKLADCSLTDKCGVCGHPRKDFVVLPTRLVATGISIDQGEDFHPDEWSMGRLRDRVDLVCLFDRTCDLIRLNFIDLLERYDVIEETVMRPEKVMRLREKVA